MLRLFFGRIFLPVGFLDLRCLEYSHVFAFGFLALLAPAAQPPVLTETTATAVLAGAALPPVLADTAAAAVLARAAPPPVLADTAAAALLALAAPPPVLADADAAALLARAAHPPVLADAAAAALLALGAPPPVRARLGRHTLRRLATQTWSVKFTHGSQSWTETFLPKRRPESGSLCSVSLGRVESLLAEGAQTFQ